MIFKRSKKYLCSVGLVEFELQSLLINTVALAR
jgi:hypothetical protein